MKGNRIPPFLDKGDKIGLVATARHIDPESLAKGIEFIEDKGLRVRKALNLFERDSQFAGSDEIRAAEFQKMLDDPQIKAILCVRGGYGTVRMVDMIDWTAFNENPKWICGYSDVTVLLNHLGENLGVAALHSSMPVSFGMNTSESVDSLFDLLKGNKILEYPADVEREGSITGEITGGNLSVIYSQLGSKTQIHTRGKILFLEDVDEHLYHVDRMIQGLKRAGILEGIAGLIVGGMTQMRDNTIEYGFDFDNPFGYSIKEIIMPYVPEDVPVCFDVPVGHQNDNRALVFNASLNVKMSDARLVMRFS